ncbi:MAG: cytochrome c [Verrucomicrobiae bacterium]|nr:cytochrome c [Verrucomicrobiae bacterium]MCP5540115.1 cytochrome c [Akkermansiaceae bacterium]
MRWFFLILTLFAVMLAVGYGARGTKFSKPPFELFPDMDRQYKVKYQKPSEFFEDGSGARRPVVGTIPMGYQAPLNKKDTPVGSEYYRSGLFGDFYGDGFPEEVKVDAALLDHGRRRFQIYCTPCHGESGNGQGVVAKYWLIPPTANLVDPRVKALPDGQIFWTITHGKGLMGPYSGAVPIADRWAITAYVRALQGASGN